MINLLYTTGYECSEHEMMTYGSIANILRIELELYEFQKELNLGIGLSKPKHFKHVGSAYGMGDDVCCFVDCISQVVQKLHLGEVGTEGLALYNHLQLRYKESEEDLKTLEKLKKFEDEYKGYAGVYFFFNFDELKQYSDQFVEEIIRSEEQLVDNIAYCLESSLDNGEGKFTFSDGGFVAFAVNENTYELHSAFEGFLGDINTIVDMIEREESGV